MVMKMAMSGFTFTCLPTISTAMVFAAAVVGRGERERERERQRQREDVRREKEGQKRQSVSHFPRQLQ